MHDEADHHHPADPADPARRPVAIHDALLDEQAQLLRECGRLRQSCSTPTA